MRFVLEEGEVFIQVNGMYSNINGHLKSGVILNKPELNEEKGA